MKVGEVCTRRVRVVEPGRALAEAAREMCHHHIGALLVVEPGDAKRRPIGILTDRDILLGQLARSADLFCLTVGDVMTRNPLAVTADMSIFSAIKTLNAMSVRRAPVTDGEGALIGVVTLDDLLPLVCAELAAIGGLLGTQAQHEKAAD
jgi:CBS domain-containing protein